MVRVSVPAGKPYYAEISGGKHRVSVRFVIAWQGNSERSEQVSEDVTFNYRRCTMA